MWYSAIIYVFFREKTIFDKSKLYFCIIPFECESTDTPTITFLRTIPIGEFTVGYTTWTDATAISYSKENVFYQFLGNAHASYTFLWIWPEKILNRHALKRHTPITRKIDGVLPPNYRMDRGKPLLHIRLGMMLPDFYHFEDRLSKSLQQHNNSNSSLFYLVSSQSFNEKLGY